MIDIEDPIALERYLRQTARLSPIEAISIQTLAGGVSNRTVLVQRTSAPSWVLKQALPKLRVKVDWFSDPARIRREAEALRQLPDLCPPHTITPLIFEDPDQFILAMQAVPQPHDNWKSLLLAGRVDSSHVHQFGALLGTLHRRGHEHREQLAQVFADRSFFESLRLEPYYAYTAAQVPSAAAVLSALIDQTRSRRLSLVHGDYSPKNILVHNDRLILLDHEVIHFGDPAFDIGFAMAHLLSKAHHLPDHRSLFADAARQFWVAYVDALGNVPWRDALESVCVRHTLACLLARVDGRSPLDYLTELERQRQRSATIEWMRQPPGYIDRLIDGFIERISG